MAQETLDGNLRLPQTTLYPVKTPVKPYAASKQHRAKQDSEPVHSAKIFAFILAIFNLIAAIVTAQPPFEVSDSLHKNISRYAISVLLSACLAKARTFIPSIFRDTLKAEIQEAFTQLHAKLKKTSLIAASVGFDDKNKKIARAIEASKYLPRSSCTVTVELCARVALMVSGHLDAPNPAAASSSDKVDDFLAKIRNAATFDNAEAQVARAFRNILTPDRNTHNIDNF
ncbi:hypothetical protein GGX14DRAFT_585431 [Mycena pura]|uniref:Uncharacterized protein n=1 Tax=Mycena pura TaxID=153505 RepID=A0AAD6VRL1_9AGAR|nr:hypothetical protein GGX14DRAFT_585431 [Mycena pura]